MRARTSGQPGRRAVGIAHDDVDAVSIDAQLVGDKLLVRGDETGAVFLVAHHQLDALVFEFDRGGLGKAAAAALGIGRHADAPQLVVAFASRAALRERGPFGRRHAAVHHLLEFTGVEQELGRRRVGHRRRRHEIDAADGVGAHAELARGGVDQALEQVCGLGSPGAAIGANRYGVGTDAFDVHVNRPDRIETGDQIRRAGRHEAAERRQIGAKIGQDRNTQAEKAAGIIERQLGARCVIAALIIGDESLGAVLLPFHRPLQLAACPDDERVLGIDEGLHAERAADIRCDHAEPVFRDLEHCLGKRVTQEMRTLRRRVERRAAAFPIVIGNSIARFHRVDHETVVDEFERDDARCLGEGGLGRLGVAHVIVPIEDDVAGNVVEQLRRARGDRILGLGDRRQLIIFDLDGFSGIARGVESLGHDQRHRLTDMSNLAESKHGPRGVVPRCTVAIDQRHHAGHVTESVGPNILAGGHKQYLGHAPRRGRVDALDMRVRHRRTQDEGVGHPRQGDVVGVAAPPGDKTQILMTPYRLTNAELHAVSSLPLCKYADMRFRVKSIDRKRGFAAPLDRPLLESSCIDLI